MTAIEKSSSVLKCKRLSAESYSIAPPKVVGHSCTYDGERLFIFGGHNNSAGRLNTIWVYDIKGDTWSIPLLEHEGDLPVGRVSHTATLIRPNNILIHGGLAATNALKDFWMLDSSESDNGVRLFIRPLDIGGTVIERWAHAACCVGDSIYVYGGAWKYDQSVYKVDLLLMACTAIEAQGNAPIGRTAISMHHYENKLFIYGGVDCKGMTSYEMHQFDIMKSQWNEIKTEGTPAVQVLSLCASRGRVIYFFFGEMQNHSTSINRYDTVASTWKSSVMTENLPYRLECSAVMSPDASIYVYGGYDALGQPQNDLFVMNVNERTAAPVEQVEEVGNAEAVKENGLPDGITPGGDADGCKCLIQ